MSIPNTAQIVDVTFNLLDLKLDGSKRTTIDSRSEFQKQSKLFEEKCDLITSALSSDDYLLGIYVDRTIGTFLNLMKEYNSSLNLLATDESNKQKNKEIFISYCYLPFAIAAIGKLSTVIDKTSVLNTLRDWFIEILKGSEDTKDATKSKSIDVEAFIRKKLFQVIPKGVCGDIKNNLASNKGWKSISFSDKNNRKLIEEIETDLYGINKQHLLPEIIAIVKAGGILRNALKNYKLKNLVILNAEEIITSMDNFLISFEQIKKNINTGNKIVSSHTFTNIYNILESNLIKENNLQRLKEFNAINNLIKSFPSIVANNDFEHTLLILHDMMKDFDQFDSDLLIKTKNKCEKANDDIYKIIILNAHEQARQEFTTFIEDFEKNINSHYQIVELSCIVLAISSVMLQTMQHNKMTKLIGIIRRNLSSFGDFCFLPSFSTCFNQKANTLIDLQRFNEDSQLFTYAIRIHNELLMQNLPTDLFRNKLVIPLHHMDVQLEEFVMSYKDGEFDKKKARKLTSPNRFWRVDTSSAYEVLRDIDFYIAIYGVKIDENNAVIPLGLYKYHQLSNNLKKQALKALDPIQYKNDVLAQQNHIKAKKSGKSSFIGSDGLPVIIINH